MSASRPEDAEFELPVEHPLLRKLATFTKEHQLWMGIMIASCGAAFSILSLICPQFVILDIGVDILAAALGVTFIRRTITVKPEPVEVTASPSVAEVAVENSKQEEKEGE